MLAPIRPSRTLSAIALPPVADRQLYRYLCTVAEILFAGSRPPVTAKFPFCEAPHTARGPRAAIFFPRSDLVAGASRSTVEEGPSHGHASLSTGVDFVGGHADGNNRADCLRRGSFATSGTCLHGEAAATGGARRI